MRAEFCIFESNAPGLKANFYEPYVDKPSQVGSSIPTSPLSHLYRPNEYDRPEDLVSEEETEKRYWRGTLPKQWNASIRKMTQVIHLPLQQTLNTLEQKHVQKSVLHVSHRQLHNCFPSATVRDFYIFLPACV